MSFLRISHRNMGPPRNAVITPTCITAGIMTVLPMMSEVIRSAAPKKAEAGIRYLLSAPMKSLTMCGATSPTKPIRPVKLTMAALIIATTTKHSTLTFPASMPSALAFSSPVERRFSSRERNTEKMQPTRVTANIISALSQSMPPSVPTCHL